MLYLSKMGLKIRAKILSILLIIFVALGGGVVLAQPATTNYKLNSYGFGSGGSAGSGTSNYSLEGISGELSGQTTGTVNYSLKPGYIETQQAHVPTVTLTNPSNYYDKLHFVIGQQDNPTDALYALQISTTSDFSSSINYVKSDNTIGPTLTTADYQTYSVWTASGGNIIGLSANTTYYLRAKATQGQYTESAYGPASSAATVGQQISFCLYTNANCGAGGHSESLNLLAGSVSSSGNIGVDFSTNANNGGNIYVYSNGALSSTSKPGTPINSVTADLSLVAKGYGAQVVTAVSMTKNSPFNSSGNQIGVLSTTIQTILSATAPVTSNGNQIQLQAKSDNVTIAAPDYTDVITIIAAASF